MARYLKTEIPKRRSKLASISKSGSFCRFLKTFTQPGADPKALTEDDILGPSEAMRASMDYFSHTKNAPALIGRLAQTKPTTLACMHGSSWRGDGEKLLLALGDSLDR